jgi:HAD superfamily hydrolase (TIGR01490 family)
MALAIFDLDNTLLGGDSDHAWGEFACEQGLVDPVSFGVRNEAFYRDYQAGKLDIQAYVRHALTPLVGHDDVQVARWHTVFMREKIEAMLLPKATHLLNHHRERGDQLLIITATSEFITRPIADLLEVEDLLACQAEQVDGRYTGQPRGILTYAAGKVARLEQWLAGNQASLEGSWFYSDSHNDIPLLEVVDHAVAVDADDTLRAHARRHGWQEMSLR